MSQLKYVALYQVPVTSSSWSHRQTAQCYFRSHRQDAEQCPSTSGSKSPCRLVSWSTPGLFVEASARSSSETMAGPNPWRQPMPSSRCVERRCQTRSLCSDAMVLDDYALTTTRQKDTRQECWLAGDESDIETGWCCITSLRSQPMDHRNDEVRQVIFSHWWVWHVDVQQEGPVKTCSKGLCDTQTNLQFRRDNVNALATTYFNQGAILTFDLQNLTRSSVWAIQCSLSVLSKLLKAFMSYCGNDIWPDERINGRKNGTMGQPRNIMP